MSGGNQRPQKSPFTQVPSRMQSHCKHRAEFAHLHTSVRLSLDSPMSVLVLSSLETGIGAVPTPGYL